MDQTLEAPPTATDFEEIPAEVSAPPEEQTPELFCDSQVGRLLTELIEALERPEESAREMLLKTLKKMENYWRDRQYIIWDEMASDWRTPMEMREADPQIDIDPAAYAKIVNIYKTHGEAIISALSAGLPFVRYFPDDADSPEDVFAAKSYSKIGELIQKRNKGQLLFIKALFYLYNCGTVFAYNENKDTDQFGMSKRANYQDKNIITRSNFCPSCGYMLGNEQFDAPPPPEQAPPQGQAPPESVQGTNSLPVPGTQICPQCQEMVQPQTEDYEDVFSELVGETEEPKSHEFIEIFSPMHVKAALWATQQSDLPCLTLETEAHCALLQDVYTEVADKIKPLGDDSTYERQARRNSDYRGDSPRDLCTLKRSWIRPWAYNHLGRLEDVAILKEAFPDGVYFARVDDIAVEAVPDRLDDHWTVTVNPLSTHMHADPLAQPLVPIQDITNELVNITLETVEFGIPETFYDSETIDSEQYGNSEARPGMLYPAKARPTMGLDSSFYTVKTATLGQEVGAFAQQMTQAGQQVVGALPTIWGGALEGSGGTAKEVEQSRAAALQRLNLTWTMVKVWWAEVMSKSVRSFAVNMKDDEKFVQAKGSSFINVWIRQAEMTGKVGSVEPDVNEAFPISWAQKRDILMGLIAMKNPMIESVIAHPENAGIIAGTVGFPELYIPGDDARNKQLYEIGELIMAEAIPTGMPGPDGQEVLQPTVPIAMWENHAVEAEVCKAWLMSEVGLEMKKNNPGAYMNVVAHMQMHDFQVQQAAAAEAEAAKGADGGKQDSGQSGDQPNG